MGVATIAINLYEKEIINSFTTAANQYLKTKIDGEIEGLTLIDKFPQASIRMKDVTVYGSPQNEKLAELESINFTISLFDLLSKNYKINAVYLEEGFINLYKNENGEDNFTFIEKSSNSGQQELHFAIREIYLKNIQLNYADLQNSQNHKLYVKNLSGKLKVDNQTTTVSLEAGLDIEVIMSYGNSYLSNKTVDVISDFIIDNEVKSIKFSLLDLIIDDAILVGKGNINYADTKYFFNIKGKNTTFKTISNLLPHEISSVFKEYETTGKAQFNLKIKKNNTKFPAIDIQFGCENVSLKEPNTSKLISQLNFKGHFTNGSTRSNTTSKIVLSGLSGKIDNHPFQGEITYSNLDNPYIDSYIKGKFPASFIFQFADSSGLVNTSGSFEIDLHLKSLLSELKQSNPTKINSSGQLNLIDFNAESHDGFYHLQHFNGSVLFNQSDVSLSGLKGTINNSDFKLDGVAKGFFGYFFTETGKLIIDASLQSKLLNFDRLMEASGKSDTSLRAVDNNYLKRIQFNLNTQVKTIKWGRFTFKNASGNLLQNNLYFKARNIKGEIANGGFLLNGTLDTRDINNIKLDLKSNVDGIEIDSIFYLFNNFGEDFITYENLKGKVYVAAITKMNFDQYLNLKPKSLIADFDIKAKNGELNNFEPMQNLSKFIDEDQLKNIEFSELTNHIHIENEKIEIPEMLINSTASNITLRGTHTFDQHIYYKLKVPLKNLKSTKRKEAQTAYRVDENGPALHLIISGTTDDFDIKYDKKETSEIIKDKVKDEIKEIKDVIKGDYQEEEEEQIGLEEENFFDFESDTTEF